MTDSSLAREWTIFAGGLAILITTAALYRILHTQVAWYETWAIGVLLTLVARILAVGLSRSLLKLAERGGMSIIPSVHRKAGGSDIAAPLEKIDPEAMVALAFAAAIAGSLTRRAPRPGRGPARPRARRGLRGA